MNCNDVRISEASPKETSEILNLLSKVDLPHDGVKENIGDFLVARDKASKLVGTIGLERHGNTGLLRSAAVVPDCQHSGLGSCLTKAVLERAATQGVEKVVLLTTTARGFFEKRFGFSECSRLDFDKQLAGSVEWRLPRCSSAVCMSLELSNSQ